MIWKWAAFERVRRDPSYRRGAIYFAGLVLALVINRALVWWVPPSEELSGLPVTGLRIAQLVDIAAMAYFASFGAGWFVYRSIAPASRFPIGLVAAGLAAVALPLLVLVTSDRGEAGEGLAVVGAIAWYLLLPAAIQDLRIVASRRRHPVVVLGAIGLILAGLAYPIIVWSLVRG